MPYVTSIERAAKQEGLAEGKLLGEEIGIEKGKREGERDALHVGLAVALKLRFGPAGTAYADELRRVTDPAVLGRILAAVETADSLDDLRRI